jgi:hypothetical protein
LDPIKHFLFAQKTRVKLIKKESTLRIIEQENTLLLKELRNTERLPTKLIECFINKNKINKNKIEINFSIYKAYN